MSGRAWGTVASDTVSAVALRRGALAGLIGQAVFIGAGVLTQILLARLLTPGQFGGYNLLTTLVYFAAATVRIGLQQVVVRVTASAYLARGPDHAVAAARRVIGAATIAAASACPVLAFFVVPSLFAPMFHGELEGLGFLVAGIVAAEAMRFVISESFRGLHQQIRATVLGNAGRMLLVLAPLLLIAAVAHSLSFTGLLWLLLGASTATLLAAALSFLMVVRGRVARLTDRSSLLATYRSGLPFLVAEVTAGAMAMGDVVVIGHALPHNQLALYAAASRVAALIAVPVFVATTVLPPAVASLWSVGRTEDLQLLLRGYGFMALVPALAALLTVVVFGPELLSVLFGSYYAAGWKYLVILSTGAVLNTVLGLSTSVLMMTGNSRVVVRVMVLAATATISAEAVMVRVWGAVGVALMAAIGLSLQQLVLTVICARTTDLRALPGTFRDAALAVRGLAGTP